MWLRCSTAVRDLTSQVTVLEYHNTISEIMICQGMIHLGDGTNDLDGSGGDFELTLMFGSQTNQPDPQLVYFSSATRSSVFTVQFPLPINETVTFKLKSPNAADTSVWTHACIYEAGVQSLRDDMMTIMAMITAGTTIQNVYDETARMFGGVYIKEIIT